MAQMRNATFTTTVPHLFSSLTAQSLEIKPYYYITFQCVRNASNKSIEFPDFQ